MHLIFTPNAMQSFGSKFIYLPQKIYFNYTYVLNITQIFIQQIFFIYIIFKA